MIKSVISRKYVFKSFWQKTVADLSLPSLNKKRGSVVQLVRMLPCHGRGRGFESRPVRKIQTRSSGFFLCPFTFI